MIISVDDTLINTQTICKISPVYVNRDGVIGMSFDIQMYNSERHKIHLNAGMQWGYRRSDFAPIDAPEDKMWFYKIKMGNPYQYTNQSFEEVIVPTKEYQSALERINKCRDEVVKYWQESPSKIPKIEL